MRIPGHEVSNVAVIIGYALHTEIKTDGYRYMHVYK